MLNNPAKFFDTICELLFGGTLYEKQVSGITAILDAWSVGTDSRWIAYSLATAYHETAHTMQPDREIGQGAGHPYGVPVNGHVYYGRGLIQLTWLRNYQKMQDLIPGSDLVNIPDNALDPDIAAKIMVIGMTQGVFTGRKLEDYFWGPHTDYYDARRIINGLDKASLIAGYAYHFYHAMEEA